MCDDPYYYRDGRSYQVTQEVKPNYDFLSTTEGPKRGKGIVVPGRKGRLLAPSEKMDWDPDIPLKDKVWKLSSRYPWVPFHTVSILVHDTPEWSVDQLAEVLKHLQNDEEVAANTYREKATPIEPPPSVQELISSKPQSTNPYDLCSISPSLVNDMVNDNAAHKSKTPSKRKGLRVQHLRDDPSQKDSKTVIKSETNIPWKCSNCTLDNLPEVQKCAACDQPKTLSSLSNNDKQQLSKYQPKQSFPFNYQPTILQREEIRPGLVIMRGVVDIPTQQWIADEAFRLASNPDGRSGGFFRVLADGQVALNEGHRGSFAENISQFAPHFQQLCAHFLNYARELSPAVPHMAGKWLGMKFYDTKSKGLLWHRDGDDGFNQNGQSIRPKTGRPVVSFTIGCACDFRWKMKNEDPDNILYLGSGDILVFGGPSRNILHAVTKIHAGTSPKGLKMKQGRLNLTYRHGEDN